MVPHHQRHQQAGRQQPFRRPIPAGLEEGQRGVEAQAPVALAHLEGSFHHGVLRKVRHGWRLAIQILFPARSLGVEQVQKQLRLVGMAQRELDQIVRAIDPHHKPPQPGAPFRDGGGNPPAAKDRVVRQEGRLVPRQTHQRQARGRDHLACVPGLFQRGTACGMGSQIIAHGLLVVIFRLHIAHWKILGTEHGGLQRPLADALGEFEARVPFPAHGFLESRALGVRHHRNPLQRLDGPIGLQQALGRGLEVGMGDHRDQVKQQRLVLDRQQVALQRLLQAQGDFLGAIAKLELEVLARHLPRRHIKDHRQHQAKPRHHPRQSGGARVFFGWAGRSFHGFG